MPMVKLSWAFFNKFRFKIRLTMKIKTIKRNNVLLLLFLTFISSCTWDEIVPIDPCPARPSDNLTATFAPISPNNINSTFWNCIGYLEVNAENQVVNQVTAEDGILNTSETYQGVDDFNNGYDP